MVPLRSIGRFGMIAAAVLVAASPAVGGEFDNAQATANAVRNLLAGAMLRPISGDLHLVVIWQSVQPANLSQLVAAFQGTLNFTITEKGLPSQRRFKSVVEEIFTDRRLAVVFAVDLEPDALQMISYYARRSGVLTIGSDEDVDPIGVGIRINP